MRFGSPRRTLLAAALLLLSLLAACGGGPRGAVMSAVDARDVPGALHAYERFRRLDGPDGQLLAPVAALILEKAALGHDPKERDAAIEELAIAGTAGHATLERIAQSPGDTVARAEALRVLAERGDDQARAYLYALLDSHDPDIVAAAITAIDAPHETHRLLTLLGATATVVRRAAALHLGGAAPAPEARLALAEVARVDPEPTVRQAAVRALGSYGHAAVDALRERLGDPSTGVRQAAVRALVQADRGEALAIVGGLLDTPPGPAGIEAARVIAMTGVDRHHHGDDGGTPAPGVVDARAYLLRALASDSPADRAQAGFALASMPNPSLVRAIVDKLRAEHDPEVQLALATALVHRPSGEAAAKHALRELVRHGRGMPAVQAASILAPSSERDALRLLARTMRTGSPILRRVAARAMARDALRPDAARAALTDPDGLVRVSAAGGILAAFFHLDAS